MSDDLRSSAPPAPLAIVGAGCRLPGDIESPTALLDHALARRSAITEVPADRWDADAFHHPDFRRRGSIHSRFGGFVSDIDRFDAAFFGISPNEARRMDPQQRLMLEVGYRAIEDAGMRLDQLAGRDVAVVVGVSSHDYEGIQSAATGRHGIGPTSNTGVTSCIVANRLSYAFDLRGPSVSMDTACSSALTALHHGCQSIWNGLACGAIVGGVNVLLKPELTMGFSKGGYLSPDGQCRAFSDHANGYVRSEGAGAVFIKRLDDALASGDRVLAVIRSTWINQDGRSQSMTMPRKEAQVAMLRAAYRRAGLDPADVVYVEAHGTGTQAGDPIEAAALGEVIGRARGADDVCWIGSVKTNLGHLESGAGIAGLLKLVQILRRRVIPPNLHFRAPNPAIDFEGLRLRVPTRSVSIDGPPDRTLTAGLNSFGFGGANAHAVLQSAPPARPVSVSVPAGPGPGPETAVLMLCARSAAALRRSASALARHLEDESTDLDAVAATLARRRSRFEFRLGVVGEDRAALSGALRRYADQDALEPTPATPTLAIGRVAEGRPPTEPVFVFSGQGPQWWAMGRQLLEREPVFRATVEQIDRELRRLGWLADEGGSLLAELTQPEERSRMQQTRIAQPCIYALQVGLVRVLAAHGVRPRAVVGHSIGELAAAVCAGVLTLEEGARLVHWRSHCQAQAEGRGRMAALGLSADEARRELEPFAGAIELAAVNGPSSVTVAGDTDAVAALVRQLEAREVFCRELSVSVPFHCFLMDPVEDDFRRRVGEVETAAGTIPFFSTVDPGEQPGGALSIDYWYRNIRAPVLFLPAFEALLARGWRCFVEIGPHPILERGAVAAAAAAGVETTWLPTLRRTGDERILLGRTLAGLHAAGAAVEPVPVDREFPPVELPVHPFDRQRFWLESEAGRIARLRPSVLPHPHLLDLERSPKAPEIWSCPLSLDPRTEPYIAEHRIQGDLVVFPGAGQLELTLAAAAVAFAGVETFVEDVEFMRPIVLPGGGEDEAPRLRLSVYSDDGSFEIASRGWEPDEPWTIHTRGRINHCGDRFDHGQSPAPALATLRDVIDGPEAEEVDVSVLYRAAAKAGLELGPSFQGIRRFWAEPDRTVARIEVPSSLRSEASRFALHPALLDCLLQSAAMGELYSPDERERRLFLPSGVGAAVIHRPFAEGALWCHARSVERGPDRRVLDVVALAEDGEPVVTLRRLELTYIKGAADAGAEVFYSLEWEPIERPAPVEESPARGDVWLVLGDAEAERSDRPSVAGRIARSLHERGHAVAQLHSAGASAPVPTLDAFAVDPTRVEDYARVLDRLGPDRRIAGIVHAWTLVDPGVGREANDRVEQRGPVALSRLIAAIGERDAFGAAPPRLWLLTAGIAPLRGPVDNVAAAKLWGLGRVLMAERPRLHAALLDLPPMPDAADLALCLDLVAAPAPAHELAIHEGRLHALRLSPTPAAPAAEPVEVDVERQAFRAVVRTPGVVSSASWQATSVRDPAPHEVVVAVRAASLNFKDVAVAMGMLGDEAWEGGASGTELGLDCSGVVVAVGSAEGRWSVGDEVVGVAAGSLASHVVVSADYLVPKPPSLSWTDAAALPTVYGTASLGLEHVARLEPGETILVHAAAGGVGSAAIHIAQRIGARIIGTTSTEDKRAFLRGLGVEHILHSRTPHFRQAVLDITDGRGADVVLNSLSGRSMTQSIRALAPFGRFIEIGKTDIYADRQLGLRVFGDNRSYHVVDFNRWIRGKTRVTGRILADCVERVARGDLAVPPVRCLPASALAEGMQFLARAKHIGKVVIELPTTGPLDVLPDDRLDPSGDHTLVVTGGCRGFGLAVARRLAERGARHLTLVGRSGVPGPEEQAVVDQIRARGTTVRIARCDVGERERLSDLLQTLRSEVGIGGVFHAAAVLDDAPIESLDRERFARVGRAKADGAWFLHELTRDDPLRYFVLFSSVAGVLGSPGQGNYAAANVFLDQLAHYRRARGLPALAVDFGVIDVGMVARASEERRRRILGQGIDAFDVEQALDALERLLVTRPVQRVAAAFDWTRIGELSAAPGRPGRFSHLAEGGAGRQSQRERLAQLPKAERVVAVADSVARFLATLLGLDETQLDRHTSTDRLGLDSLVGTQLQSWMEVQLGVVVPLVRLLRGQTIHELASELAEAMDESAPMLAAPHERDDDALVRRHPRPGREGPPRARLFCFPYMGAGAEAFAPWADEFDPDVELVTVRLPSLDGARRDLLRGPIDALRDALLEQLAPLMDRPFGFYGHSVGGWIALDLAAAAERRSAPAPGFVAAGALLLRSAMGGLIPAGLDAPEDIGDDVVRDAIAQLRIDPAILTDARVMAQTIASVRRDLWIGHQTRVHAQDDRPLPACPIAVLGGRDDPLSTVDRLDPPALDGRTPALVARVPGGHLFLSERSGRDAAREILTPLLEDLAVSSGAR